MNLIDMTSDKYTKVLSVYTGPYNAYKVVMEDDACSKFGRLVESAADLYKRNSEEVFNQLLWIDESYEHELEDVRTFLRSIDEKVVINDAISFFNNTGVSPLAAYIKVFAEIQERLSNLVTMLYVPNGDFHSNTCVELYAVLEDCNGGYTPFFDYTVFGDGVRCLSNFVPYLELHRTDIDDKLLSCLHGLVVSSCQVILGGRNLPLIYCTKAINTMGSLDEYVEAYNTGVNLFNSFYKRYEFLKTVYCEIMANYDSCVDRHTYLECKLKEVLVELSEVK